MEPDAPCVHWWKLGPQIEDGTLLGICKHCGSVRYYGAKQHRGFNVNTTWESNPDEAKREGSTA